MCCPARHLRKNACWASSERAIITKDWTSLQSVMVGYANRGCTRPLLPVQTEAADAPTALGNCPLSLPRPWPAS